jgi:hypothetical protein
MTTLLTTSYRTSFIPAKLALMKLAVSSKATVAKIIDGFAFITSGTTLLRHILSHHKKMILGRET